MQTNKVPDNKAPTGSKQMGAEHETLTNLERVLSSLLIVTNGHGNGKPELSTGDSHDRSRVVSGREEENLERLKIREQWLREEIRAGRTLMLGMMSWGVVTLAGLSTALYYVRRDVANNLLLHNVLPPNGTVPAVRWFVGTAFLFMVATMFCMMTRYMTARHIGYRSQLVQMQPSYSGIVETVMTGGRINYLPYVLFLAFPAVDCLLWFYFHLTSTISIPW